MLILKQFREELPYFLLRRCQSLLSSARCPVRAATPASIALLLRAQQAARFQPMQHGINGARAELVAVPSQLFDHAQPKDRFFAGMVQNVQPDESGVEVLVTIFGDAGMTCHRLGPLCR